MPICTQNARTLRNRVLLGRESTQALKAGPAFLYMRQLIDHQEASRLPTLVVGYPNMYTQLTWSSQCTVVMGFLIYDGYLLSCYGDEASWVDPHCSP